MTAPNPGSPEARAAGCVCPVLDNEHGKGRGGDGARFGFVKRLDCKLHGEPRSSAQVIDAVNAAQMEVG